MRRYFLINNIQQITAHENSLNATYEKIARKALPTTKAAFLRTYARHKSTWSTHKSVERKIEDPAGLLYRLWTAHSLTSDSLTMHS
jgi:hypothetical protein